MKLSKSKFAKNTLKVARVMRRWPLERIREEEADLQKYAKTFADDPEILEIKKYGSKVRANQNRFCARVVRTAALSPLKAWRFVGNRVMRKKSK